MAIEVITYAEFEPVVRQLHAALERIAHLETLQDTWVSVAVAEQRTGKDRKTLLKETQRKGTLLISKIEGKRTRLYSANGIVNYNNRKALQRQPERQLTKAPELKAA